MNDAKTTTDKIFFSYATVAQMGRPAYDATKQFLDDFYRVGPPEVLYHYEPLVEELAAEAAILLNCDSSEITYIKNTTEGINIASDVLPLEPGDEIIVLGNEYPANLLPWLRKRKDGITVTVIPGTDNVEGYKKLFAAVGPKTKVIATSSAQWYDGYCTNLKELSDFCRESDIFLMLDAVQSVGVRKIDLAATPVDFLVCGGQKYLQAGMGIGFMYVNKDTLPKLHEGKVGIRSMTGFTTEGYTLRDNAARFQDGTQNMGGIVALHASLKHINSIGIETIERKNLELLGQFKAILREHDIPFIDRGDQQSNILSMLVDDPSDLFNFLKDRSVYIKPIKDIARLSFIHESKIEDVQTLAKLTREWMSAR